MLKEGQGCIEWLMPMCRQPGIKEVYRIFISSISKVNSIKECEV